MISSRRSDYCHRCYHWVCFFIYSRDVNFFSLSQQPGAPITLEMVAVSCLLEPRQSLTCGLIHSVGGSSRILTWRRWRNGDMFPSENDCVVWRATFRCCWFLSFVALVFQTDRGCGFVRWSLGKLLDCVLWMLPMLFLWVNNGMSEWFADGLPFKCCHVLYDVELLQCYWCYIHPPWLEL